MHLNRDWMRARADFSKVAGILDTLNDSDFYLADYWAAEAVRFATDAHVFSAILEKEKPSIHAHLGTNCLSPDTYCQVRHMCVLYMCDSTHDDLHTFFFLKTIVLKSLTLFFFIS